MRQLLIQQNLQGVKYMFYGKQRENFHLNCTFLIQLLCCGIIEIYASGRREEEITRIIRVKLVKFQMDHTNALLL